MNDIMGLFGRMDEILRFGGNRYEAFRRFIMELKNKGFTQREVYTLFDDYLKRLLNEGCINPSPIIRDSTHIPGINEEDEDLIRDLMDLISGWCSEDVRLWDGLLDFDD